jgi:hypothetical protein
LRERILQVKPWRVLELGRGVSKDFLSAQEQVV